MGLSTAAFLCSVVAAAQGTASRPAAERSAAAAKPEIGKWGFDESGMDRSVKPGDDFYRFAVGAWEAATVIPPEYPHWDSFNQIYDRAQQQLMVVIEETAKSGGRPGSTQRKVADFYNSFMDEAAIEAKGSAPLAPYLQKIANIRNGKDLAIAFAQANRIRVSHPFRANVWSHPQRSEQTVPYLSMSGLGLPSWNYYLDETNPNFAQLRLRYRQHVANMLSLAGLSDADRRAEGVLALEMKMALAHQALSKLDQEKRAYLPISKTELRALAPEFDWHAYFEEGGFGSQSTFFASGHDPIASLAKLAASEPLGAWKDYLAFRTVSNLAPLLPKAFVDEKFAFDSAVSGSTKLPDRRKRGIALLTGAVEDAVGQLYVARHFRPEAKAKMEAMVANVIRAMDARLAKLDWMSPDTR